MGKYFIEISKMKKSKVVLNKAQQGPEMTTIILNQQIAMKWYSLLPLK
jgi:hypothetical protein